MNLVIKTVLCGVYDKECVLYCLQNIPHVLKHIWFLVKEYYCRYLIRSRQYEADFTPDETSLVDDFYVKDACFFDEVHLTKFHTKRLRFSIENPFPAPKDININMMPYVYGEMHMKEYKLPKYLEQYLPLIMNCGPTSLPGGESHFGKIFYLTIQEGWVEPNQSQRRPGVHTDNPGPISIEQSSDVWTSNNEGRGNYLLPCEHYWAGGLSFGLNYHREGGIYMISNTPNSCRVWNCKIDCDPVNCNEIIGEMGNCEHIKEFLPKDRECMMEANRLYWITDRTPHEFLPLKEKTYQQFLRVVTEDVSIWFADHSTPNPEGVQPDPYKTTIVTGNKFDKKSLRVVPNDLY